MKLHWASRSPFVRKVMVFAHEAGVADRIEFITTRVSMTQPNTDLLKVNPLGKIPTLITDDGMVLFDSTVICEYLDTLHKGTKLIPRESGKHWQALRWHAMGDNMLDSLVMWRNETLRPQPQQSPETIVGFLVKTQASLDALEKEEAQLSAALLGIGHVGVGVALGYLDFRFADLRWRDGRPKLAAWYEGFAKRPSMQKTMPVDS